MKKAKGITLIALIVTVIVLLILAGVALKLIAGGDGILGKATNAVDVTNDANIIEDVEMLVAEKSMDYYTKENRAATLGEDLLQNTPAEGFEGRDNAQIFFESIEDGIVHITYIDKNGNETYLTMNLDGSNIRIVGRGNTDETIDVVAPSLQIISSTTNSITFQATDRVGVVAYQITEENSEPSTWETVEVTTRLEKTIFELENNKTYYIWAKDEAGNVRSKEAITADFESFSHKVEWNGTTAAIEVTSPKTGVQFKIGTNGSWTDCSETSKPSVLSGTEVFFQATDGKNEKQYSSVTPLWIGTVSYDANGGTGDVPSVQEVEHTRGVEIDFTKKPTKEGEAFLGWAKNKDAETADYSENGTKQFTMELENVTLYAVWQKPLTADSIAKEPKKYFGQIVNYTPPNNATSKWQVFYADTENIYLVSKDFVPISSLPAGKGGTKLTTQSSTSASFNTIYNDYVGTSDFSSSKNSVRKWFSAYLSSYSSTNKPWKITAYLVDTNVFSVFADINLVEYAVGAPPFELFWKSYNILNPGKLVNYSTSTSGYGYTGNLANGGNASGGHMQNIQSCGGLYNANTSSASWSIAGGQSYGGSSYCIRH